MNYNYETLISISSEKMNAPFLGFPDIASEKLKKMGVIDEKENMYEISITILATVFSQNFYDRAKSAYSNESDSFINILFIMDSLKSNNIGLYYYLIYMCADIACPVPYELICIAAKDEILSEYLKVFVEVVSTLFNQDNTYFA